MRSFQRPSLCCLRVNDDVRRPPCWPLPVTAARIRSRSRAVSAWSALCRLRRCGRLGSRTRNPFAVTTGIAVEHVLVNGTRLCLYADRVNNGVTRPSSWPLPVTAARVRSGSCGAVGVWSALCHLHWCGRLASRTRNPFAPTTAGITVGHVLVNGARLCLYADFTLHRTSAPYGLLDSRNLCAVEAWPKRNGTDRH